MIIDTPEKAKRNAQENADAMDYYPANGDDDSDDRGCDICGAELTMTDGEKIALPTFGGPEPADTMGVWSWDVGRMIVESHGVDSMEIVPRDDDGVTIVR